MDHAQQLGMYLFIKGESVARQEIVRALSITEAQFTDALTICKERVAVLGLSIVDDGKELELRIAPEASAFVETIRKEEFSRDIGKAGIETLSIVLYNGSMSRSEIDYIRGVNSSHILRGLAMRGLLRRVPHPKDDRSFLFEPTTDLLAHLGVQARENLPDFKSVTMELAALEKTESEPVQSND